MQPVHEIRWLGPPRDALWPRWLFLRAQDPFDGKPPPRVRAVLWQYWFADPATRRNTGAWWTRRFLGPFTPIDSL